jgi:chromosomal replication initiator protein
MYLGRELTPHSAAVIGKQFGGKDHTTVLSAARKIRIAQYGDDDLSRSIGAIKRILVESEAVIPDAEWPA